MLIAMAVHDTEENGRTALTRQTLESLDATVDWSRHRLILVDNGSCRATQVLLGFAKCGDAGVIAFPENIGTARAINQAWTHRHPDEVALKMDNDVVIHQPGWADLLEEVLTRDPSIGIVGLKRKDLAESPDNPIPFYTSRLQMLPHTPGQRWLVVEEVLHVMGTCQAFSPALLKKIGYLSQPGVYGFDDSLMSLRARLAHFRTVFLHGIEIDHIDPGGTPYTTWKAEEAGRRIEEFSRWRQEYASGKRSLYEPP